MSALITGGAGFIGSHLADRLVQEGDHPVLLDDLSTGRRENVTHLLENGRAELVVASAADARVMKDLVERADVVYHLAAAVGVRLIVETPVHTIVTNIMTTEVVLAAAAQARKPVLLASTSEVYGKTGRRSFHEEDDLNFGPTVRSRWAYACSKAMDEWLALAYRKERGLPVVVARLFNTVGPRQRARFGMVLPNFARQALRGAPLTVHGSGQQTRCFAHVRDTVEALVRLARNPGAHGMVVNVGSDEEVSIRDLAQRVRDLAGSSSPIAFVPYDEAYGSGFEDMPRRVPDLERLQTLTGFRPRTPLAQTIADVLQDMRSSPEESSPTRS